MAKIEKMYNVPCDIVEFYLDKQKDVWFLKNKTTKPISELSETDVKRIKKMMVEQNKANILGIISKSKLEDFIYHNLALGFGCLYTTKQVGLTDDEILVLKFCISLLSQDEQLDQFPYGKSKYRALRTGLLNKLKITHSRQLGFIRAYITPVER